MVVTHRPSRLHAAAPDDLDGSSLVHQRPEGAALQTLMRHGLGARYADQARSHVPLARTGAATCPQRHPLFRWVGQPGTWVNIVRRTSANMLLRWHGILRGVWGAHHKSYVEPVGFCALRIIMDHTRRGRHLRTCYRADIDGVMQQQHALQTKSIARRAAAAVPAAASRPS